SNTCDRNGGAWEGWKKTADILSPDPAHRTAVCYDGRDRVEAQAGHVARQIAAASCGQFQKCIVLAHSMGGLMMEYILHNARDDSAAEDHQLFAQIKKRILFII